MEYMIVDLEATRWERSASRPRKLMETIEIGAVRLTEDLEPADEVQTFVRPDGDAALFRDAFERFLDWMGSGPYRLCSWGRYDINQLRMDCKRFGLLFPEHLDGGPINITDGLTAWRGVKRCGMAKALDQLGMPLTGTHHRGIDDARNIACIAQLVIPHMQLQDA